MNRKKLTALGLRREVVETLNGYGYETPSDLARSKASVLAAIPGVGRKVVAQIRGLLAVEGLAFKAE